jgi:DNA-binding SARP family transcriptional activator
MESSLSSEEETLTEIEVAYSQLGLPASEGQFIATTQGLDAMKRILHAVSVPSVFSLLESGLNFIRQRCSTEGLILLALARERLAPDQVQLAAVLDTFIQGCGKYCQAQEALHQASKRFAEIDAEQQAQIAILEKHLPTLMQDRDIDSALHAIPKPLTNSNYPQILQSSLSLVKTVYPQGEHLQAVAHLEDSRVLPALYITCFGCFEVKRSGQHIVLCSNRNGQAILRYLVAHSEHRATMDTLMAVLWPEDEPEVAHHKLQVAVSALRRSLNHGYVKDAGGGYILCKNRVYELNPLVPLQTDVDEFLEYYQAGRQSSGSTMAVYYERACDLYTGPFLSEDLYADWSFIRRRQLSQVYLSMCNALAEYYLEAGRYEGAMRWIGAILKENRCDEVAHRQLIRAYAARGRRSDALRQYQLFARILAEELGAQPMPETVSLFQAILNNENLPEDGTK